MIHNRCFQKGAFRNFHFLMSSTFAIHLLTINDGVNQRKRDYSDAPSSFTTYIDIFGASGIGFVCCLSCLQRCLQKTSVTDGAFGCLVTA